jgi:phage host-nuclease inhibitor protein Gam
MVKKPVLTIDEIVASGDIDELNALARRRRELTSGIAKAINAEKAICEKAKAKRILKTKPLSDELKKLDTRMTKFLKSHKRYLWKRFGKVIELPDAVIRYRTDAPSLDTPRSNSVVIDFLRAMRGGDRYLKWTPTLNRDAITQANSKLHAKLKHLGVWVGRHAIISIRSRGEEEPTTLDRSRYRERR